MSEDAVVRVVLVDSTTGTSRNATQSATAGTSGSSTQPSINPDRLFRELTKITADISSGFKNSLYPVVRTLTEIRDILDRDYDYSEKDYRESIEQTSLLKFIGAALSGDKGAVTREITKSIGLQSGESQIILALKEVSANVRDMKLSLSPEAETRKNKLLLTMVAGALSGLGISKIPDLLNFIKSTSAKTVAAEAASIVETRTDIPVDADTIGTVATTAATAGASQSASNVSSIASNAADLIAAYPLEAAAIGYGVAAAGILYSLIPKPEKEKTINELLADINTGIDNETTTIQEQTRYIQSIVLSTEVIRDQIDQLIGVIAPHTAEDATFNIPGGLSDESASQGYEATQSAALFPPLYPQAEPVYPEAIPVPTAKAYNWDDAVVQQVKSRPMGSSADYDDEELGLGYTNIPKLGYEIPKLGYNDMPGVGYDGPDDPGPGHSEVPRLGHRDLLADWTPRYRPGRFLSPEQREELQVKYGIEAQYNENTGRYILDSEGYDKFLAKARDYGPPQYLARGGVVESHPGGPKGTDTVPAWLTPGETVIPRHMAEGGVVGKTVGAYGNILAGAAGATTDPGTRIAQFGNFLSTVGAAIPVIGGFVQGIGEGAKAVSTLMQIINGEVDKYGEYSPEIAQAQAMVEIRQTMGDMRRAQEIGSDMAKFVVIQGEMQQKLEEAKLKVLMSIVPAINKILDAMNNALGSGESIGVAISLMTAPLVAIAESINAIRGLQEDSRLPDIQDPTTALFDKGFDTSVPGGGSWVPIR